MRQVMPLKHGDRHYHMQFHLKCIVLSLAFTERIAYDRNLGYQTPGFSVPFNTLTHFTMHKNEMVPRRRFELPTPPLPRVCSTPELPRR